MAGVGVAFAPVTSSRAFRGRIRTATLMFDEGAAGDPFPPASRSEEDSTS